MANRVGEVSYTRYGTKATIVEYVNNKKVLVEFDDEHKYRYYVSYINFKNGSISNPYDKSVLNIGYIGEKTYDKFDSNIKHIYGIWTKILTRCYATENNTRATSYKNCEVCEEWKCFNNFLKWYLDNQYKCDEQLCVDKDILVHNNRIYSPEYCLLVPERINLLFIKSLSLRGTLPIGVSYYWFNNDKYLASMKTGNRKNLHIGIYNTVNEAFEAYKKFKENYIKKIADEYKDIIPNKIYDILYNYQVLITD